MNLSADVPVFPEFAGIAFPAVMVAVVRLTLDILALALISDGVAKRWGGPVDLVGAGMARLLIALATLTGVCLILGYAKVYSSDTVSLVLGVGAVWGLGQGCGWKLRRLQFPPSVSPTVRRLWRGAKPSDQSVVVLIGAFLLVYGVAAALTTPLGYDENAYRLPRIAVWQATGSIHQFESGNDRMAYMPVGVDLVQSWLCGHFPRNFPLIALAGWIGGVLSLLSILALGRLLRMPRSLRLLAALLLLIIPNVQAQFMSSQTDLLTAGYFSSGLYFLWRSISTGRYNAFAAVGLGLACGAKGTAYFIGAGFAVATLVAMFTRRTPWRLVSTHTASVVLAWAAFALPRHWENLEGFGGPFGPATSVREHTAFGDVEGKFVKLWRDTVAYGIQNLQPAANPPALSDGMRAWMKQAVNDFASDSSVGTAFDTSRQSGLRRLLVGDNPDADVVGFGILAVIGACVGTLVIFRSLPSRNNLLRFLLPVGALLGYVCFSGVMAWQLYAHRLFVPWAPFLCLLIMWPCRSMSRASVLCGVFVIGWYLTSAVPAFFTGVQYGMNGSFRARSQPFALYRARQSAIIERLADGGRLIAVATQDHFIGGFFRTGAPVAVVPMSHEQATVLVRDIRALSDPTVAIVLSQRSPLLAETERDFVQNRFTVIGIDSLSFAVIRLASGADETSQ